MNLVDEIDSIVGRLTGSPAFSYKGKYEHNASDHLDYSNGRVNLFEIEQPGFKRNVVTGALRDRFPIFIEFVRKSDQDLTAIERHTIVEEMRRLAAEFIYLVEASGLFEDLPEIIPGVEVVDRYDTNVAGYELNLTLVSLLPIGICM